MRLSSNTSFFTTRSASTTSTMPTQLIHRLGASSYSETSFFTSIGLRCSALASGRCKISISQARVTLRTRAPNWNAFSTCFRNASTRSSNENRLASPVRTPSVSPDQHARAVVKGELQVLRDDARLRQPLGRDLHVDRTAGDTADHGPVARLAQRHALVEQRVDHHPVVEEGGHPHAGLHHVDGAVERLLGDLGVVAEVERRLVGARALDRVEDGHRQLVRRWPNCPSSARRGGRGAHDRRGGRGSPVRKGEKSGRESLVDRVLEQLRRGAVGPAASGTRRLAQTGRTRPGRGFDH